MPAQAWYVILLLVVAVIFGYFYLKRAQRRTTSTKVETPNADMTAATGAPPAPSVSESTAETTTSGSVDPPA